MKVSENKNMEPEDVILIDPPFGSMNGPSMGLPVLVSSLRRNGIRALGMDLNPLFYRALLTKTNIRKGLVRMERRFALLNRKDGLSFSRMVEYEALVNLLVKRKKFAVELAEFFACPLDSEHVHEANDAEFVGFLLELATIIHFLEIITFSPRLRKTDRLSKYSSVEIIKAAGQKNFYTEILENVLRDALFPMKPAPLLGISVSFSDQVISAFQCARMIRKQWPETHITFGGSFVSIHFREIRNPRIFDMIDSLVLDEGEVPLERLCEQVARANGNPASIPNLVTRREGKIHMAPRKPHPPERLSFIGDYSSFDPHRYLTGPENVVVPLCLSRGCRWKRCAFCRTELPVFGNYCRPSPEAIYGQLAALVTEHGVGTVSFSSAFSEPEVLDYLSRRILEDGLAVRWVASSRLCDDFTRDLCVLLRDAGCIRLSFGIESFSDRILKLIKKGITARRIEKVVKGIDGVIPLFLLMMVGIPTETEQEALDGFEKIQDFSARKLIAGYHYNLFHITYGSHIWNNPEKYSVSDIHWLSENDLFPNVAQFKCSDMTREKAHELHRRFSESSGEQNIREVDCGGKDVLPAYDLDEIGRKIQMAQNGYLDVCYGRWLRSNRDIFVSRAGG